MEDILECKRIQCLGIGGIGLSAVAEILEDHGHVVSGTDLNHSEVTDHLESRGIKIYYEHRPENVHGVDAVIYSNAVSDDNPELIEAKKLGIPCMSRSEALGMLMKKYKHSIGICGTHGKTTTTSMISLIIKDAGLDPTILVGGNLSDIHGNVEIGARGYFVTEACEYMDSFLNLRPSIGVVLNIDSDHLDYFKGIEHIVRSFKKFVSQIPDEGVVVAFSENPFMGDVIRSAKHVITYGFNDGNDFCARRVAFNDKGFPGYDLYHMGNKVCHIQLNIPGEHNVLNSLAAFATCDYLGIDADTITSALNKFKGTHRRFDFIGTTANGVSVIDDYAHHPTEIRATLKGARNLKFNKLWCVFQPHTYTRTKALFDDFVDAFKDVDKLIITDIYAAREKDVYGVSSHQLVQEIKRRHPELDAYYIRDFDDISKFLKKGTENGDVVMTMGAGDVYKVGRLLLG